MAWVRIGIIVFFFLIFLLVFFTLSRWIRHLGAGAKDADQPSRWSASQKPATGGIGFFLALITGLIIHRGALHNSAEVEWLVPAGACMAFVTGFWDDLRRLRPLHKLIGQLVAAACLVGSGQPAWVAVEWVDVAFKMILIVGIMNSINMLDNMDGVASAAALAVSVWFALNGALLAPGMVMTGALLAFLVFNHPPSRIFMGDSGSMTLGYALSLFLLHGGKAGEPTVAGLYPTAWVILLTLYALPLADSLVVVINRMRHGVSPARGGRDHTTHHLVYAGLSERSVFILFILLAAAEVAIAAWFHEALQSAGALTYHAWLALPSLCFIALLFLALWTISLRNLRQGKYAYPS